MATKLKDLKLDDAHATAVLEKAIEYESFTEEHAHVASVSVSRRLPNRSP